jgi:uncharacterized protein YgbK (DUF1537 family)
VNEVRPFPVRVRILADDLTGACDSAAPVAALTGPVPIFLSLQSADRPGATVSAMDLDVRDAAPAAARASARRAARSVDQGSRILIKVDSAGRGPIRELLDGSSEGAQLRAVVVAPALPGQGTTVVGGRLRFARGRSSDGPEIARLIASDHHDAAPAHLVGLSVVRRGPLALVDEIEAAIGAGLERLIIDADDEDCLTAIAGAWLRMDGVGMAASSGMARALASLSGAPRQQSQPPTPRNGPILIVVGSPSPVAQSQVNGLLEMRSTRRTQRTSRSGSVDISDDREGVVVLRVRGEADRRDFGEKSRALGQAAAAWINHTGVVGNVVLVGGATARAFMTEMRISELDVTGEQSPGIAHGWATGGVYPEPLRFLTKSGSFGKPDALMRLVQDLRNGRILT